MNTLEILAYEPACAARRGQIRTAHGLFETPAFMAIGTRGAVRGLTPMQVQQTGTQVLLANTYHLLLRPGVDAVERLGGLHKFMAWPGPILTDSGGYQVFSLSSLSQISDDGVEFASHIDGSRIHLDARNVIEAQNRLGADIIMCFDECTPFPCDPARLETAVNRTIRWAKICRKAHNNNNQLLFGIIQGGIDPKLRSYCAQELVQLDFDGYAIGGLSVGEGHDNMVRTVAHTTGFLPTDKPRYLMGAGTPRDIVAAVRAGIDMFDCVLPSRNGRNAFAFTDKGPVRLRNADHADDSAPIDQDCPCYCCSNFSRGAIRHFFNVGEMLGPILVSVHNIAFYQQLMSCIRREIENGSFACWADKYLKTAGGNDSI